MSASAIAGLAPPPRWLIEDLQTDWVPDALGGYGATGPAADGSVNYITVATSTGERLMPLAPVTYRAHASLRTDRALSDAEAELAPTVCGYRDLTTPYRYEWRRMQRLVADLTENSVVMRADVKSLFDSVSAATMQTLGLLEASLLDVLEETSERFGVALLPGHRWSRRTANIVLSYADRLLSAPFVRWQDDYHIFTATEEEGVKQVESLNNALGVLGLTLNQAKTRRELRPTSARFLAPENMTSRERLDQFKRAIGNGHSQLPWLKRLLRTYADIKDPAALSLIVDLVLSAPSLAPRGLAYVALCLPHEDALRAIDRLCSESRDLWIASRTLAAATYSQVACRHVPEPDLRSFSECGVSAVEQISARVAHAAGRTWTTSDRRLQLALRLDYGDLKGALPVVQTTL